MSFCRYRVRPHKHLVLENMTRLHWLTAWLIITGVSSKTVKVFKTTEDYDKFKESRSGAELRYERNIDLKDVSICFRFYFFGKESRNDYEIALIHSHRSSGQAIFEVVDSMKGDKPIEFFGLYNIFTRTHIHWPIMEWHNVCWSYRHNSGVVTIASEGEIVVRNVIDELLKRKSTATSTRVYKKYSHHEQARPVKLNVW